jgi:mannosyltransferase
MWGDGAEGSPGRTPPRTAFFKGPDIVTAGIVAGGFALRLFALTKRGLWLDEALGVQAASLPGLSAMLKAVSQEIHPPLFYLLLRAWMSVFGGSDLTVRLFAAVWGGLGIYGVYFLCRAGLAWSRKASNLAAAFAAVLPLHAYYSQEVRPYVVIFALACFSLGFLFRAHRTGRFWDYALFGLGQAALLYLHHTAILYCLSLNVLYLLALVLFREADRRRLMGLVSAGAISFVLYLPWLPIFFRQLKNPTIFTGFHFWVPVPAPRDFFDALAKIAGIWRWNLAHPLSVFAGALVWAPLLFFLICGISRLGERSQARTFVLASATLAYPLFIYFLSHVLVPVWLLRILAPAAVGVPVTAALGVEHRIFAKRKFPLIAAVAFCLGVNLFTSLNLLGTYQKEDWKELAAYLSRNVKTGDSVQVYREYYAVPLERYTPRGVPISRVHVASDRRDEDLSVALASEILNLGENAGTIYLILAGSDVPADRLLFLLKDKFTLRERRGFAGGELYVLRTSLSHAGPEKDFP